VTFARSLSFRVLTCPSLCAPQQVGAPYLFSFRLLTCPLLCALQLVSVPCSFSFFPCPDFSVVLRSPVGEFPSLGHFFHILTCLLLYALQFVSALSSPALFRVLTCPLLCGLQEVSATRSPGRFLFVLTHPSLCGLQEVSVPRLLAFFPSPHLSVALRSPVREWLLLARFLSVSSLLCCSALSSS
jgi:hypothetical protein